MASSSRSGFTLIELLVTISIIAILVAILFPALSSARLHAQSAGCESRMRALGIGFVQYTSDNDGQLPSRSEGTTDKWPLLLENYVGDVRNYVDPGDPVAVATPLATLLSNTSNGSSFFFNGFNDLGFYSNPDATVRMVNLSDTANLILLGQKVHGDKEFYMDFVENNESHTLNKTAYFGGSNYVFADGSARFMLASNYSDSMWLVNKNYTIPGH